MKSDFLSVKNFMGITPDYEIQIRPDLMDESDGPMLKHGLQGMQGESINVPRKSDFKPNRDFLDIRYSAFKDGS